MATAVLVGEISRSHSTLGLCSPEEESSFMSSRSGRPIHWGSYTESLEIMQESVEGLLRGTATKKRFRRAEPQQIVGVCISIVGDVEDGVIASSSHLRHWIGYSPAADLAQLFAEANAPVVLMSDYEAATLGEYSTTTATPFLYVRWDTDRLYATVAKGRPRGGAVPPVTLLPEFGRTVVDDTHGHLASYVLGHEVRKLSQEVLAAMAIGIRSLASQFPGLPIVIDGDVPSGQSWRIHDIAEMLPASNRPQIFTSLYGGDELAGAAYVIRQLIAT